MSMRILGIDPGSRVTGYGVIESSTGQVRYIDSGAIKTSSDALPIRLSEIYHGISDVISTHQPETAVVEKVFVSVNPQSALKLGHARGSAICACAANLIDIYEYSAREIKKTITGSGSASKDQIQYMVQMLLTLSDTPGEDEADALAGALTHFQHIPLLESGSRELRREANPSVMAT